MAKNLIEVKNGWFEVDKSGLSKLLKEGGKGRLVGELIQNSFDTDSPSTHIKLELKDGLIHLEVKDDSSHGFKRLADAWTLFAESEKKANNKLRGRFNLGEKLVLSICEEAKIASTKGTVKFHENGTRIFSKNKTLRGSIFSATMKGNAGELAEIQHYVRSVLVPNGHRLFLNDSPVVAHKSLKKIMGLRLETVGINKNGDLIRTARNCEINIYEPTNTEVPHLYEMGLPVVPLDDYGIRYHIDIGQKVPLNFNRDSVPAGFLKKLFTQVFNNLSEELKPDDFNESWVNEATSSDQCDNTAFKRFVANKFGEKTAFFDPSDLDANKNFQADGGVIIYGRMLNKQQIENAKDSGVVSSGKLTPSHMAGVKSQVTVTCAEVANIAIKYFQFISKKLTGEVFDFKFVDFNSPLVNYKWQDQILNLSETLIPMWELVAETEIKSLFESFDQIILPALALRKAPSKLCKEFNDELCRLTSTILWIAVQNSQDFQEFWEYAAAELEKEKNEINTIKTTFAR